MITPKMRENSHKVAFLVKQYPKHKMTEIVQLLEMPAIDINTAIWAAQDSGFVSKPDKKGSLKFLKDPESWAFGETVMHIEDALIFAFEHLAESEADLEEHYLSQWTRGYSGTDVLIALNRLLSSNRIAEYAIEDGENTYKFFTLYENRDKLWGNKQFKKPPLKAPEK